MSSDLYLGLTTLEAAVFAIFAASLFVLIQTATDLFSPFTPHFLLRRRAAIIAISFSFVLFALGMLISIRVAFPESNLIRGDQRTGFLIDEMWPALLFVLLIAASVLINTLVLIQLIGDFRGPGVVRALVSQAEQAPIKDWLDLIEPPSEEVPRVVALVIIDSNVLPADEDDVAQRSREERNKRLRERLNELRRRHDDGALTDPLAPLFEVAAHSIETRRYTLVDRALSAVRIVVRGWLTGEANDSPDPQRTLNLLLSHLSDLLEVATDSGSHSQTEALIRICESMAADALERTDHSYAVLLSEELVAWSRRLDAPAYQPTLAAIIHSIYRVGRAGLQAQDLHVFEQCLLDLARIAEILGQRYEEQRGSHLLERNAATAREELPTDALVNTTFWLVEAFTDRKRALPHDVVLVSDALYVCTRAFLEAPAFDERAAEIARSFYDELRDLALTAAKCHDGDALWKTVYDMDHLSQVPTFANTKILRDSLAWGAFQAGMVAEANHAVLTHKKGIGVGVDVRDRLADLCARSTAQALQEAVFGLFSRGHTTYIPHAAQEAFLCRIEARTGWQIRRY